MKPLLAACFAMVCASAGAQTFYVSNQQGGVTPVDFTSFVVAPAIDTGGQGPRGIAVTTDGALLLTANQGTGDLSVIDRHTGHVLARIPIGPSAEMVRVRGHVAYVTHEPKGDAAGRAAIAVVDLDRRVVTATIQSGHETEGLAFSPDGTSLLVANEGDNTVSVYALPAGTLARTISTGAYGERPRGIAVRPNGQGYVVSLEFSAKAMVLDRGFNVVKTFATADGPYGLAFSPDGKRLFVAAAKAGLLQAFDAASFAPAGQANIGKRCWHFSFTQDGRDILAACGRSNAVFVVDAASLGVAKTLDGFKMPWGIVAYPAAAGSLQ